MDEQQRHELGRKVTAARLSRGLGKEPAARAVGVSSITLKRVEDGLTVREDSLAKILSYFGVPWPEGAIAPIEVDPDDVARLRRIVESADVSADLKQRVLEALPKGDGGDAAAPTRRTS